MVDKTELRAHYLSLRHQKTADELRLGSQQLAAQMIAWLTGQERTFSQYFLYLAHRGEPDLSGVCDHLLAAGKRVGLPVVGAQRQMAFYAWQGPLSFTINRFGIKEPVALDNFRLTSDCRTLIVVPALAIDRKGQRLGYGGGFYDRFLAEHAYGASLGVVWSEALMMNPLPVGQHDVALQYVGTEHGVQLIQ